MNAIEIRRKMHQIIETMEDAKLAAFYPLFVDVAAQRRQLIQEERIKYMNGEGKSYTPDEVRQLAINKTLIPAI